MYTSNSESGHRWCVPSSGATLYLGCSDKRWQNAMKCYKCTNLAHGNLLCVSCSEWPFGLDTSVQAQSTRVSSFRYYSKYLLVLLIIYEYSGDFILKWSLAREIFTLQNSVCLTFHRGILFHTCYRDLGAKKFHTHVAQCTVYRSKSSYFPDSWPSSMGNRLWRPYLWMITLSYL